MKREVEVKNINKRKRESIGDTFPTKGTVSQLQVMPFSLNELISMPRGKLQKEGSAFLVNIREFFLCFVESSSPGSLYTDCFLAQSRMCSLPNLQVL